MSRVTELSVDATVSEQSAEHRDLLRRAAAVIPGGTFTSLTLPPGQEFLAAPGAGAYLVDYDGRRYLDFQMGAGPLILGHAHPAVVRAIQVAAGQGTLREVFVLPYNDAEQLTTFMDRHGDEVAAVIVEPYQRMLSPVPGFLEELRRQCDRHGSVLIFDEVVTGFRLGPGGAQAKTGVIPDLAVFGKGLSGGLPLSALTGRRWLMERLAPQTPADCRVFQCGTLNGNLLAVEAAHACLDELDRSNGYDRLQQIGQEMRSLVARVFERAGVECFVAGEGPMFHPYFSAKPVRRPADLLTCDTARAGRFHQALQSLGVYKPFEKGYLSLAHGADELRVAERSFAQALRQS